MFNSKSTSSQAGTRPKWLGEMDYPIHKFLQHTSMKHQKMAYELTEDSEFTSNSSFFKFMNTRNPLDRIYSAWSDKFILKPSVLLKPSLIKTLEETFQSPCHSEPLLNKMRMAHYIRESKIIKHHVQKINFKYESPSTRKTKKSPCELVSFPAFLTYILDDIPPSSPNLPRGNSNAHWEPIYKICQPCHIKYHLLTTEAIS